MQLEQLIKPFVFFINLGVMLGKWLSDTVKKALERRGVNEILFIGSYTLACTEVLTCSNRLSLQIPREMQKLYH